MNDELLYYFNPWYINQKDIVIERWENMKIRWIPEWLKDISLEPFSLNFIIGPRQVGKTTGIKLLINKLLENNDPWSIFYYDCSNLTNFEELRKVIDYYLKIKEKRNIKTSYIFLDEITHVNDWWRTIKLYIDIGKFKDDVITITGSSSIKLKGEVELFPGRRGNGKDVYVYPLSFREYLNIKGIKINKYENILEGMNNLSGLEPKIFEEFENYIETGGYPLSINGYKDAGFQIINSIENEILRSGRNLELSRAIISTILSKAPSPLSFLSIGKEVGVSYKTVEDYIEIFRRLFILDYALFREKQIIWRKERKFFILDPYLAKSLSIWTNTEILDSALYEWIVQSHLKRRFGEVYYYRNSYEIDVIAGNLKIEIKSKRAHKNYPKDLII
jgi:predicted AAA+ superfamily ATPase